MKRKSRTRVKQTSTPLSSNEEDASFKSFVNISTIQNERKAGTKHLINESSIIDWRSPPKNPAVTREYKKVYMSSKKLIKRRPDTPFKPQRSSRILHHVPSVCPVQLKFLQTSPSTNKNTKLSDVERSRDLEANKHLMYIDEESGNRNENKESLNKRNYYSKFCRNTKNVNNIGRSTVERHISRKINVSFCSVSEKGSQIHEKYIEEHEFFEHTYDDLCEDLVTAESELLHTSDMIESCRRESMNTTMSNTADYPTDLGTLSDQCINSSFSDQAGENSDCSNNDIIPKDFIKCYLDKESNISSKNNMKFLDFLPEANMSVGLQFHSNEEDENAFKGCKISGDDYSNAIISGKLNHSQLKGDGADRRKSKVANTVIEKEINTLCNLNTEEFRHALLDENGSKKGKKPVKCPVKRKRKQITQNHDLEKNVYQNSGFLNKINNVTDNIFSNNFSCIQSNIERKNTSRKGKTYKSAECQKEDIITFSDLENQRNSPKDGKCNLANCSIQQVAKIPYDKNDARLNENRKDEEKGANINESRLEKLDHSKINDVIVDEQQSKCSEIPVEQKMGTGCNLNLKESVQTKLDKKHRKKCKKSHKPRVKRTRKDVALDLDFEKNADKSSVHLSPSKRSISTTIFNEIFGRIESKVKEGTEREEEASKCAEENQRDDIIVFNNSDIHTNSLEETTRNLSNSSSKQATVSVGDWYSVENNGKSIEKERRNCNEIKLGKFDHSKMKGGITVVQQSNFSDTPVGKKTETNCCINLEEYEHIKLNKKSGKKKKKPHKHHIKSKVKQVKQGHNIGNKENKQNVLLDSFHENINYKFFDEDIGRIQTKLETKYTEVKGETYKILEENQEKIIPVFNNLEKNTLHKSHFNLLNCSNKFATGKTNDKNGTRINEALNTKKEKFHVKPQNKLEKKQEQNVEADEDNLEENTDASLTNSRYIQDSCNQKKVDKIFKKPLSIEKNVIYKQTAMDKRRKKKGTPFYPLTSTPTDDGTVAMENSPLIFKSSPIRSSKEEKKGRYFDDIRKKGLKVHKTYAKTAKKYPNFDEKVSKWESFWKMPSYQKKSCCYISTPENGTSKCCDSIRLFESPLVNINDGIPIDDLLILLNRSKKNKISKGRSKKVGTRGATKKVTIETKKESAEK